MVKLFRTFATTTTTTLFATDRVIVVEVWTIDDVVEEVVAATVLEVSTINVVEKVRATVEAKSVAVLWAIEENTLNVIIEVVDSTIDVSILIGRSTDDQCHHRFARLRNGQF